MKKKLLLFAGNFSPELTGIGKYNGEMIEWLANNGMDCTVVTTYPYYPFWKVLHIYKNKRFWFTQEKINGISILRCPHYVPANPNGIKRLISDFSIFFSELIMLFFLLFKKRNDYVMQVAPPLPVGLLALVYKKIKGAKFIYHIQDLQVDAARDLKIIRSKMMLNLMFGLEKIILKNADIVSSISEGMVRKLENKCKRKILLFPNWTDIAFFYPLGGIAQIKENYGFLPTDKIVLYSGAIGEKQGLEILLTVSKELIDFKDIKFIICGSGPYKTKLQEIVIKERVTNIVFWELVPLNMFNRFLNFADVHVIIQKKNTGDLVMPSKLGAILSVGGLAIVSAEPDTCLYDIINKNNIALITEPENPDELKKIILASIYQNNNKVKENARNYAIDILNIENILSGYSHAVFN